MSETDYEAMELNELRRYMLDHREDIKAFEVYVDRSEAAGRMITVDLEDPNWEEKVTEEIWKRTSKQGESNS